MGIYADIIAGKFMPPNVIRGLIKNLKPTQRLYKTADETVNNSATLQAEDQLRIKVETGAKYKFRYVLPVAIAAGANNIKFDLNGGTCSVHEISGRASFEDTGTATTRSVSITALNTSLDGSTTTAWDFVTIEGTMRVNQGGLLVLQFAQSAAAANNSTISKGALLELSEI